MPNVPSSASLHPRALVLATFYTFISSFPTVLMMVMALESAIAPSATAQTPDRFAPFPPTSGSQGNPVDNSTQRSAQQQLERARQQLLNQQPPPLPQEQPIAPGSSLPSTGATPTSEFDTYHLGPGESLFFNVLRFQDLSFQATLDLQGNVVVPLVGLLSLNGLTIEQARQLIQEKYNRLVVDPKVDVTLVAQRPVQITISGEVVKPGLYPLGSPQLSAALLSAGGTTRLADLRTIHIRRSYADGSTIERDVDFFTPLRDSGAIPYVRLEDGDTIIVPALNGETIGTYDRNVIARSNLGQQQITIRTLNNSTISGRAGSGARLGALQLPSGSTFIDAITSISPDPTQANMRAIALMRFDPIQGRVITLRLNARAAAMGDLSQNPQLEHGDVIVIGRSLIGNITNILNTFTQPFRDVLGFLLFFQNLADNANSLFGPGNNNNNNN